MKVLVRHLWLFIGVLLIIAGCVPPGPPASRSPAVNIEDLLIDDAVFPQGWYMAGPPGKYEVREGQVDARIAGFGVLRSNAIAHHIVFQYKNERGAAWHYRRLSKLGSAGLVTPWEVPSTATYQSPIADQFRYACAEFEVDMGDYSRRNRLCVAVARYDEYISEFNTWVSPDYMTLEELARILEAIDEQMARYLAQDSR